MRPASMAEIPFGDADTGGKIPVTMPRQVGRIPIYPTEVAVG